MKKHLLLLVFVLAVSVVQAQYRNMYLHLYHDKTDYYYEIHNTMQQRDGDHIVDIYLLEDIGNYESIPFGRMRYKISPATLTITDSLFVADTSQQCTFLSRDPRGEGNIRTLIEYHEDCDSSFVHISRFPDNDLHTIPGADVWVPVCEGFVWGGLYGSLNDSQGDLVMTYYKRVTGGFSEQYIARIGLDGTLKQHTLLAEGLRFDLSPLKVLKDSPLQYYQWQGSMSYPYTDLTVYVIDSLFRRDTVNLNGILRKELLDSYEFDSTLTIDIYEYEYLTMDYRAQVVPSRGNDILVAAKYTHDTNFYATTQDYGVAVAKYDLSTMQLKGYAVFNDSHGYYSEGYPMGLKMLDDGTVYFMYKEHGCYPEESVIIVKMDTDLNVEWKRFCKTGRVSMFSPLESPLVFDDGAGEEKGVTWCGYAIQDGNNGKLGWVYFLLNHDGTVNSAGEGIEVRPYAFYPNPVRSELHLQYSPDVQPARIELYDLQGRLLQTRTQGLESIGLEGLAAGQYLMKVTLQDGKTFTDKVVKE